MWAGAPSTPQHRPPVSPRGSGHPTPSTSGDAPTWRGSSPLGSCVYLCACVGRNTRDSLGFPGIPWDSLSHPFPSPEASSGGCALCPLGLEPSRILPGETYLFLVFFM